MRPKKTIKIVELVDMVNSMNGGSTCLPPIREGWNSLLENILFYTNNYKGFGYLEKGDVPTDCLPGIIPRPIMEGGNDFPDETRRHYCLPKCGR